MTADTTHFASGSLPPVPQRFALPQADLNDLLQRPPIEMRILIEQCLGDVPFALSLLEEFIDILSDRCEKMVQAIREANFTQLEVLAHALRGAAGYAAASQLSQICARLEDAASSEDLTQARQLLQYVRAEIARCVQEFPNITRKLSLAATS